MAVRQGEKNRTFCPTDCRLPVYLVTMQVGDFFFTPGPGSDCIAVNSECTVTNRTLE
jgi:hypothetical protein